MLIKKIKKQLEDFNKFVSYSENLPIIFYPQDDSDVMPARKRIALVAHDNFKVKMVEWCAKWKEVLGKHLLVGTGISF